MRVLEKKNFEHVFPMVIECKQVIDEYGYSYGNKADFCGSKLEIEAEDIKKHPWAKYPDYSGIDYGVICPVCGKFVVVNSEDLPQSVMKNAEEIRLDD